MEKTVRRAGVREREERLLKDLNSESFVGQAFADLCDEGCDPRTLERYLLPLARLPRQDSKRRYSAKQLERLEKLAAQLEQIADELEPFYNLLFHETYFRSEQVNCAPWGEPVAIPKTLRTLSRRLIHCRKQVESIYEDRHGKLSPNFNSIFALSMRSILLVDMNNAYEHISFVVKYVERKTGKPHYQEVATLVGAALNEPDFTVEDLKMICSRRKSKADKK